MTKNEIGPYNDDIKITSHDEALNGAYANNPIFKCLLSRFHVFFFGHFTNLISHGSI